MRAESLRHLPRHSTGFPLPIIHAHGQITLLARHSFAQKYCTANQRTQLVDGDTTWQRRKPTIAAAVNPAWARIFRGSFQDRGYFFRCFNPISRDIYGAYHDLLVGKQRDQRHGYSRAGAFQRYDADMTVVDSGK